MVEEASGLKPAERRDGRRQLEVGLNPTLQGTLMPPMLA